MFDPAQGMTLLRLAREAIAEKFGTANYTELRNDWLQAMGATFVTLILHERLRGCIGTLEAHRSLLDDVRHNAVAAAFSDPRFPPLSTAEFSSVQVEVSVLSKAEPMMFGSERDALTQLRPNEDGVILQFGYHRATFLPQVWEQLPTPKEFMAHLKNKAGLAADFWSDDIKLSRYTVQKFREGE